MHEANSDLLDRLPAADRLHGDLGFDLRAVGARRLVMGGVPFQVRCPARSLTMGPVQKNQSTSHHSKSKPSTPSFLPLQGNKRLRSVQTA